MTSCSFSVVTSPQQLNKAMISPQKCKNKKNANGVLP